MLRPVRLEEAHAAAARIRDHALRTPLLRLALDDAAAGIWVKLENLQPIGSFKIRGAGNAMLQAEPARLEQGVYTASAGNMAQGVGWMARALGVPWRVIVPDRAPQTKLDAIRRLGGETIVLPFEDWWRVLETHGYPGLDGVFIHPVSDQAVMAGNATIGLEILQDLPDVDTIVVPYGGGGLSCGIAAAVRALKPDVTVLAAESESAAPLRAALDARQPVMVPHTPSFVDGIGGRSVLAEMWPLARQLLHGTRVVGLDQIAAAIRLLVERQHVVAEGAGAAAVAVALAGMAGNGRVACVVSGGNIDAAKLATILSGAMP